MYQSLDRLEESSSSAPSSHAVVTLTLHWHDGPRKVPRKHPLHTGSAGSGPRYLGLGLFFSILTTSESHGRDRDSRLGESLTFLLRADGSATRCAPLPLRPICFEVLDVRFGGGGSKPSLATSEKLGSAF